jgi:CMP-2-keto-3-deoxyoctulosonic acid synthetase
LSKNVIPEIEEIEHLSKLRVLELGSNKIRVWTCLN